MRKTAVHPRVRTRLAFEALCLTGYADSPHLPELIDFNADDHTLTYRRVRGRRFDQVFGINEQWQGNAKSWSKAKPYLAQYVEAETDLLDRGLLYRGVSPERIVFTGEQAVLLDHDETIGTDPGRGRWHFNSQRGTWELMAPEEFYGRGYLSAETATYRTAAIAHLALAGQLPYARFSDRSEMRATRMQGALDVADSLSKQTQKVIKKGLNIRTYRRHANPSAFFEALTASYEDTV